MKTENSFDIGAESRAVLLFAVRQSDTLRAKLAPLAAALFDGDDIAIMSQRLQQAFLACRGESLSAKQSGRREQVKAIGKAWNRFADGLRYHASTRELTLTFPNLASGDGTLRVERSPDASLRRKAEKLARDEADASALAVFQADQQQAQLEALRELTPAQLADSIIAQLHAWSDDSSQWHTVSTMVHNAVCRSIENEPTEA